MEPQVMKQGPVSLPIIPSDNPRNHMGDLGERCNNCGGIGFTNSISGGSIQCRDCFKTGVKAPDVYEMQATITRLEKELKSLKKK